MADLEVIIIGAGGTGLLLAQGLKLNDIKATVYEREDASTYLTRPREWGMTLHFGQEYLSKCIPPELMSRLNEACCDPFFQDPIESWPMFNGETGEKFFDMQGFNPLRVSRRKLRALLSDGINVQYGKKLSTITVSDGLATAKFSDDTSASATLIVGAEGVHSPTRSVLVGVDAALNQSTDVQMINTCWRLPAGIALAQRKAHPIFRIGYHPNNTQWVTAVQNIPDPNDPKSWLFQQALSWAGAPRPDDFPDQKSKVDFVRKIADEYVEPWKSAGKNIPDDQEFGVDVITMWKPEMDWTSSPLWPHVTLAGDAAHNMPPFRGQGLNQGFMDAEKLVSELVVVKKGEKEWKDAIKAYEEEMKPRSIQEIEISAMQGKMSHDWKSMMGSPLMQQGMERYKQSVGGKVERADEVGNAVEGGAGKEVNGLA